MLPEKPVACTLGLLVGCLLVLGLAGGQDAPKADKAAKEKADPEAKAVIKAAERAAKVPETERERWLKELDKAFPGRVSPGLTDADFDQWFDLLSGGRPEWRRGDGPKKIFTELYDRVTDRLGLGAVEVITRAEFRQYARRFLTPGASPAWKVPDPLEDLDKLFRSLDKDRTGFLEPAEWTDRLRADARRADANRDGRIDPAEYRAYFQDRVVTTLEVGPDAPPPDRPATASREPLPPTPGPAATRPAQPPPGLPPWFAQLDTDRDGQVGLYEWRAGGRDMKEFMTMDLDADGLLPPDEYQRYARLAAAMAAAAAGSEADEPAEPPAPPTGGKKGKK